MYNIPRNYEGIIQNKLIFYGRTYFVESLLFDLLM